MSVWKVFLTGKATDMQWLQDLCDAGTGRKGLKFVTGIVADRLVGMIAVRIVGGWK